MAFDPDIVSTVTFDSYSTLVDVDAAEAALANRVDNPGTISNQWRTRSIQYTFVANYTDAYKPFYEINRDALQYALASHDADISSEERDSILAVYHELDVFDDVRDAIERLSEAGYPCYVVSNGNPEMLDSMIEHADLTDLIEDTVSADEVRTYKPAAEIYRHAAGRTGTPIDEIAHVATGWFDVLGAMHAGMQGVWTNRSNNPWEPFDGTPDLTVEDIHGLADELV
jgi:2-haloacid dehalogenase